LSIYENVAHLVYVTLDILILTDWPDPNIVS